ncbi:MAG: hypothetical protein JWL96_3263 [Sphingomonas bacterium]|uniref:hypothetical protein n=1 Tax=Sphingomonas bacterium TaxID=1895847 RepID=UPI0026350EF7|nr:hypothetical protein [Sphingomonas bacterium]MDB5711193.1 hypothetical protein [Sphingomonas bacterium]
MDAIATLLAAALLAPNARPVPVLIPEGLGALSIEPARVATLAPLRPDEIRRILTLPVRRYLGPIGRRRAGLSFRGTGKVVDGNCDPAACEGRYAIAGNAVSIDWRGRRGAITVHFYMAANGVVYEATEEDLRSGIAISW